MACKCDKTVMKGCKDKIPVAKRSTGQIAKHGGPGKVLHNPSAFRGMGGKSYEKMGGKEYEQLKKVGGGKRS